MKDAIYYYYNFAKISIKSSNTIILFSNLNNNYALVPFERTPKDLNDLIKCSVELNNLGFNCHKMVANKFGSFVSSIDNKNYVLLNLVGNLQEEIDIFDIVSNSCKYLINYDYSINHFPDWAYLWQRKVDYLESQIKAYGKSNPDLLGNFSYYIGLAENAIIYYNNIHSKSVERLTLSHRRVFFPNIWLNYGNPLSFVFDVPERDFAEYLKSLFFYESIESSYESFNILLKIKKMNKHSFELLLSRLLFPSYYFDVFEDIVLTNADNKNLIKIVDKSRDYERFLKYCFETIKSRVVINDFPSWLL